MDINLYLGDSNSIEGLPRVSSFIELGELQMEKKISSGGFGEVWKANYLGTDVAVKKIVRPDEALLQRLIQREIAALRSILRNNYGLSLDESNIYVVTEYIDGGHLWKLLRNKSKPLSWINRISLAIETAKAITFLHAKNIMHRDLKCENLLVDRNLQLKVCDFGLCRGDMTLDDKKYMTKAGTESWMAPEVIIGSPCTLSGDIYSFGVVLYELIVRERPPTRSPMNGFNFESYEEFTSKFPPDCPRELSQIAVECINPEPESRPLIRDILNRLKEIHGKLKEDQKNIRQALKAQLPPPITIPPSETLTVSLLPPTSNSAKMTSELPPLNLLLPNSPPPFDPSSSDSSTPSLSGAKKSKKVHKRNLSETPMTPSPIVSPLATPTAIPPPPLDLAKSPVPIPVAGTSANVPPSNSTHLLPLLPPPPPPANTTATTKSRDVSPLARIPSSEHDNSDIKSKKRRSRPRENVEINQTIQAAGDLSYEKKPLLHDLPAPLPNHSNTTSTENANSALVAHSVSSPILFSPTPLLPTNMAFSPSFPNLAGSQSSAPNPRLHPFFDQTLILPPPPSNSMDLASSQPAMALPPPPALSLTADPSTGSLTSTGEGIAKTKTKKQKLKDKESDAEGKEDSKKHKKSKSRDAAENSIKVGVVT